MKLPRHLFNTLLAISLTLLPLQGRAGNPVETKLWPGEPPGVVAGAGPGTIDPDKRMRNVGIPGLYVHFPAKTGTNRAAIIVCPGGGYHQLWNVTVANPTTETLLAKDIVVVVLKYRVEPPSVHVQADALADGKQAVRVVRAHAKEWGIDPHKVGFIGWSAGANLTLNIATHNDAGDAASTDPVAHESCRPDFIGLFCPWPYKDKIAAYPIDAKTPPAFIASARDDQTAPTTFAEAIAAGYKAAGVPATFWQIDKGGHGAFSAGSTGEGAQWPEHFWTWYAGVGAGK